MQHSILLAAALVKNNSTHHCHCMCIGMQTYMPICLYTHSLSLCQKHTLSIQNYQPFHIKESFFH